jgi:hypothetical protein
VGGVHTPDDDDRERQADDREKPKAQTHDGRAE